MIAFYIVQIQRKKILIEKKEEKRERDRQIMKRIDELLTEI